MSKGASKNKKKCRPKPWPYIVGKAGYVEHRLETKQYMGLGFSVSKPSHKYIFQLEIYTHNTQVLYGYIYIYNFYDQE